MNAVIYARYSSDNQREESIEGQLRECREYAEHNGMTIVGTYIDRALSAKTADRPEFQRMIKDSAKGLFEIVLVWKLDRFSRDRYDSAHYKHILKKDGVKVVSAKEHISDGPEGIILESMLEGYAEFYSAELSEKIHRGQKENALKGKNNGGGIPLGYLLDKQTQKLVVDPETAPLVVEIFERYSEGATVRSIIEDFNSRGLTTKRGKPFNANSFNALLKNRKYIGEYSYQDVVIPGGVPAIVPEDLFYRVQQRMEKNKRAPAHTKAKESEFLLTTKLFCGKCERMMVGESGKSHTGAMHYYYKCGNAKRKKGCNKKAVKKDWIERAIVRLTMERVLNEEKINRIIDALLVMQEREDVTIPALRRQLAETEKGIENMLNAIQQGIFTASTKQRLEELEKQKEELSLSMTTAELQKPKLTREYMEHWFSQFRYGDPNDREFQKRLIDTFVNAIFVYDDKLVLTYNYQHGTQTITLKEVEDFLGSDLVGLSPPKSKTRLPACLAFLDSTLVFKYQAIVNIAAVFFHGKYPNSGYMPGIGVFLYPYTSVIFLSAWDTGPRPPAIVWRWYRTAPGRSADMCFWRPAGPAGAAGIPASAGTVCDSRGNNRGSCLDREAWRSPPHNRNRACGEAMHRPLQTGPSGIWFYDTTCVSFLPLLPCKDIVQYL